MDVKWQLPPGFSAGPLRYPVPTRLTVADLMNYVYERDYAVRRGVSLEQAERWLRPNLD